MRAGGVSHLGDGLALLRLGEAAAGRGLPLEWELCGSAAAGGGAGAGAGGLPRLPLVRAASGAGASTSTTAGAPPVRRVGDMRGGALFQVREAGGGRRFDGNSGCSANSRREP